ncbi:MAG: VCBS repeat-containing protein [Planctomycetes bacterium]|nr:VCBS repeat-containing protein [Planctomycetota bacterium]
MRPVILLAGLATLGQAAAQSTENVVLLDDLASPVTVPATDTRAVRWVDVDDDGDLDLIALDYAQANELFLNEDGVLVPDTQLPNSIFAGSVSKGLASGDVDGDGDVDLLVCNGNDRPNALHLNQGYAQGGRLGAFASVQAGDLTSDTKHTYDASFGDVDGDGDLDAIVVNRHQANALYRNDGTGMFTRDGSSAITHDLGASRAVDLADLDLDGDLDVLVANSGGETQFVYVNQGGAQGGVEGEMQRLSSGAIATDGGDSYGVRAGDLDGDGMPEVLVANRAGVNFLYENVSTGATVDFAPVLDAVFSTAVNDSFDACLTDVDGDGDVDVVVANRDTPNDLFLSRGHPFDFVRVAAGELVSTNSQTLAVEAADLDGDGLPELAFANTLGDPNMLYRNLGPMWRDLGSALPGSGGPPSLEGQGTLQDAESVTLRLRDAKPSASAALVIGITTIFAPFKGGVLVPAPDVLVTGLPTDGVGALDVHATWPTGLPSGFALQLQMLVSDGGAPLGTAFSNGLAATNL